MRNRLCQLGVKEPTQWFYGVGRQFLFTFFIFRRGGRTILLRFLSSATAEERSFLILLFSAMAEEHSFLFYYYPPWATSVLAGVSAYV